MKRSIIEQMVRAVQDGYTCRSVYEAAMVYRPGMTLKVNKDTQGTAMDGTVVDVSKGTVVSVVGIGVGRDPEAPGVQSIHTVQLPDGNRVNIPFYDLGEGVLRKRRGSAVTEDDPARSDDEPGMGSEGDADSDEAASDLEGDDQEGDDSDARYVRVELAKPLSSACEKWLKSGYRENDGLELPELPEEDEPDRVSFLMKAKDQEALGSALGSLKKVGAESVQRIEPASKEDWMRA